MADIAERVDTSDLGQLAKLHETVQHIEGLCSELSDQVGSVFVPLCKLIAQVDEDIILESCSDPHGSLNAMCKTIKELGQLTLDQQTQSDVELLTRVLAELEEATGQKGQASSALTGEEQAGSQAPQPQAFSDDDEADVEIEYVQQPLQISDQELEYVQSFMTECQEHLENVETLLLTIEQTPDDLEQLNELFRPFHTIKGMAGFLNLTDIGALTHEAENLLDLSRKGKLRLSPAIIDVIFETVDVLKVQIGAIGEYLVEPNGQVIPQPDITELLRRVRAASTGKTVLPTLMPKLDGDGTKPIGEILVEDGRATPEAVEFALRKQATDDRPVGQILTDMGAVKTRDVSKALRKQKAVQETIRVDTAKLDGLVNMTGELVIAQSQVSQNEAVHQDARLVALTEQLFKITRDVQEIAMSLRMVPIAQTFHKMSRVARDIARKADKKIEFVIEGEDTELDKNVIQEIADPLMHMVRNSVDHGIETPDKRTQLGKPATGIVKLKAYHQGGSIMIEVTDDGAGLDRDKLLKKAIEKDMVSPDAQLNDQQVYQFIMVAGFSTAEKITDISGRGVGMDVVRRNIENLRGKIEIRSAVNEGSTFVIRLPLTLAVIDGMIIRSGSRRFILPTLNIVQSLLPEPDQLSTVQGKGRILNLRGELYTLISLAEVFGISDGATDPTKGMVVIVQAETQKIGIVLDEILDQQQVVIKSLGERFGKAKGVSGAAILGDGTVGLIIDPNALIDYQD